MLSRIPIKYHRLTPQAKVATFKRHSLPTSEYLRSTIKQLNHLDQLIEYQQYISELSEWEPIKKYSHAIALLGNKKLRELHYLHVMYNVPKISHSLKRFTRDKLLAMYETSINDDERYIVYDLMKYYNLLE